MIIRSAAIPIELTLKRQAAVALIGPRQVGKTTLARKIADSHPGALYLDLEAREDREKLVEPVLFLRQYENSLVVLDEIHRVPELFNSLRGIIDQGRRTDHATGRFLILGSASIDLLRQSAESLAGRIAYIDMGPFCTLELPVGEPTLFQLWLRGGFPGSYLAEDDAVSLRWRMDFIRTYLERDVPQFGPRVPAGVLERLWTMLAQGQGTLADASRLAAGLQISTPTVQRYIDLLADLLLVRRLPSFHRNIGKRLVKAPKVYVRDSGLVHALLGIKTYNDLAGHPVAGASWEGFVLENLLQAAPERSVASFYRTAAGAEIDLLLEIPGHGLWAIEIKRSLAGRPEKGFYVACQDLKPDRRFVVNAGSGSYPIDAET
ncbi:AAA family ATPase [mine drainage metagenome]|uniref:AAA family ATPase n=1 Tax=mine drainage metagenome TaxID=410659 RepID=T0Y359_9ZZZZ